MERANKTRPCPICQGRVGLPAENEFFPFCSTRCKVLDLGNWLTGTYAIPAEEEPGSDVTEARPAPGDRTLH